MIGRENPGTPFFSWARACSPLHVNQPCLGIVVREESALRSRTYYEIGMSFSLEYGRRLRRLYILFWPVVAIDKALFDRKFN